MCALASVNIYCSCQNRTPEFYCLTGQRKQLKNAAIFALEHSQTCFACELVAIPARRCWQCGDVGKHHFYTDLTANF